MYDFAIASAIRHFVGRVRTTRRTLRTERFLNALPSEIRADIGWPDVDDGRHRRSA